MQEPVGKISYHPRWFPDCLREWGNQRVRDEEITLRTCILTTCSYLCETYDKEGRLLPHEPKERVKVRQWVHAAEATFTLHAHAILSARWHIPKDAPEGLLETTQKNMSANVQHDMSWLETELSLSPGKFLCGEHVTAADTMMQVTAEFIIVKGPWDAGERVSECQ